MRLMLALALTATAIIGAPGAAYAAASPDGYLHTANSPPRCASPGETPDPSVPFCQAMTLGGTRIALSTQSLILNVGDAESSRADCQSYLDAVVPMFTLDGVSYPITTVPCRYVPPGDALVNPFFRGHWATFNHAFVPAGTLAPGVREVFYSTYFVRDYTYSLSCTDPSGRCTVPAGSFGVSVGTVIIE